MPHRTFVIVDLETTGLDPLLEGILEIAAVKMVAGDIVATYQTLVKPAPGIEIAPDNFAIHGISTEMVADALSIEAVLPDFLAFLGADILVAHNAPFDLGFLNRALSLHGWPALTNDVLDTLEMAREVFPEQRSHKLESLCKLLDHPANHFHRAADDAGHLAAVFPRLLSLWEQKRAWYRMQFGQIDHLARRYDQLTRLVESLQAETSDMRRVLSLYFTEHPLARVPLPGGESLVQTAKETFDYDMTALGPLLEAWGHKEKLMKLDRQRLERWLAGGRFDAEQTDQILAARVSQGSSQRIARAGLITATPGVTAYAREQSPERGDPRP